MIRATQAVTENFNYRRLAPQEAFIGQNRPMHWTKRVHTWQTIASLGTPPAYPPSRGIADGEQRSPPWVVIV